MNKLDKILFEHGIYPNYKGYEYIKDIIIQDKSIALTHITDTYKAKAEKFNTTAGAVDRAIRNLRIKSNFNRTTNKQFLAILQLEYKGENKNEIRNFITGD